MLFADKYISIKYVRTSLKKRDEALSALLELSNFLSVAMEFEPLLKGALAIVLKHFDLDSGRVYLTKGASACARCSHGAGRLGLGES